MLAFHFDLFVNAATTANSNSIILANFLSFLTADHERDTVFGSGRASLAAEAFEHC